MGYGAFTRSDTELDSHPRAGMAQAAGKPIQLAWRGQGPALREEVSTPPLAAFAADLLPELPNHVQKSARTGRAQGA